MLLHKIKIIWHIIWADKFIVCTHDNIKEGKSDGDGVVMIHACLISGPQMVAHMINAFDRGGQSHIYNLGKLYYGDQLSEGNSTDGLPSGHTVH